MDNPILSVKNLSVQFNGEKILSDIAFSLEKGMAMAIVGPNGAGKSVLFKALLGLIPYSGEIVWQKGIKVGYVPQRLAVDHELPLSVREFLRLKGNEKEIQEALSLVDIHDALLLNRPFGFLSGGEIQRVLVAWAIIGNPDVLLFDEPVAGIDLGGEETIYNLMFRLHTERGLTLLLISHDIDIVYRYTDTVLCLNKIPVCFGKPEEALTAESLGKLYGAAALVRHQHRKNA
ncbi:MAG: metal ABC transporter ATP-binding protein [Candidatus Wildermuthbacteria bacterium]|nr:metal ABC transporter ATP-binding protein [Candidatus Wildermuthbacteria bacterium]